MQAVRNILEGRTPPQTLPSGEPRLTPKMAEFWGRAVVIGPAKQSCRYCHGLGWRELKNRDVPCNCVYRAVFRACFNRYRELRARSAFYGQADISFCWQGRAGRRYYSRKNEEYMADFELIARRELDAFLRSVFELHVLRGWDWKACTRRLNCDRGNFFHAVYRIEQHLGRVFRELRPYGLYPMSEYFAEVRSNTNPILQGRYHLPHGQLDWIEVTPTHDEPLQLAAAGGF